MWQSYKKMHLTYGTANSFDGYIEHSPEGLFEGMKTDSSHYAERMNNLRYGSFARAKLTQQGGIVSETLNGAAGHYKIIDKDCGSKKGITVTVDDPKKWLGVYKQGTKTLIDSKKIKKGDILQIRAPQYCKSKEETFCQYCISDAIVSTGKSLSLYVFIFGSKMLFRDVKIFHVTELESTKVNLLDHIT
jgi:hypothetical protein